LNGVELSKAKLNHIKLPDASLEDSVFVGTDLVKANLCDAYLFGANLEKADLTEAILIDVDFTNARLNEATLTKANLTGAKLINAELKKADFQGATLTNVNLKKAILDGSKNLWDAELDDVTLNYASVKDANLEKANFKQTNFKGVQLDNSVLLKSDLSQVTNLSEQQLTGNNPPYLCATSLPQNLQIDGDRDCERLVDHFSEKKGESREESRKYIDKVRME
ncbi:MAG: pentapeptide repeat-containing protein, partial [Cyanobacteria bacterium J06558_2]